MDPPFEDLSPWYNELMELRAQLARAEKVIAAVPDAIAMLRQHGYTCELMRVFAEYDRPSAPRDGRDYQQ